jgi:hypothetical protein
VGVAGLVGDAIVKLGVQIAELVHDGGLGLAADLAAGAFPVAGVAQSDLAAPQARAVPVAFGVAAGTAVLEGDAVFAAPAAGSSHGDRLPRGGDIRWWRRLGMPRHSQALQDQKRLFRLVFVSGHCWPAGGLDVHGKEKVYGSIP